jgi:fatty acid desaturase
MKQEPPKAAYKPSRRVLKIFLCVLGLAGILYLIADIWFGWWFFQLIIASLSWFFGRSRM